MQENNLFKGLILKNVESGDLYIVERLLHTKYGLFVKIVKKYEKLNDKYNKYEPWYSATIPVSTVNEEYIIDVLATTLFGVR